MNWNYDITSAPRGKEIATTFIVDGKERTKREHQIDPVWLATADGKVHRSYWIPANKFGKGRWAGFTDSSPEPIAWQAFVVPEHPGNSLIVHRHSEINVPFIEDCGSGA